LVRNLYKDTKIYTQTDNIILFVLVLYIGITYL